MNDKLPIFLLDGSAAGTLQPDSQIDVVEMQLNVAGELVPVRIGVRNGPAKLADIAPMARGLSSKIADAGLKYFERKDKTISCRKRCVACCHYIVALSAPDVFCLVEEVLVMLPEQRKKVIESFSNANKWFKQQQHAGNSQRTGILPWYRSLRYPCPFLHNNQCTIYENRLIVCREWMVIGTGQQCRDGSKVRRVLPSVHIGDILNQLVGRLEDNPPEDVILLTVFEWYSHNVRRSSRTWPAKLLVEQFLEILKNQMSN